MECIMYTLLRLGPLFSLGCFLLGLEPRLYLGLLLSCRDAGNDIRKRVLNNTDPPDLWRQDWPVLRVDIEVANVQDVCT